MSRLVSVNRFVEEKTDNDVNERMTTDIMSNRIKWRNTHISKETDDCLG